MKVSLIFYNDKRILGVMNLFKIENKSNIFNQLEGLSNISVIFASYQGISLHNSLNLQEFKMYYIEN